MDELCKIKNAITLLYEFEKKLKKQTGLTLNEAFCLCNLSSEDKNPSMLSKEIGISISRISRVLNSLEKKGLIRRKISSQNKREITVNITESGSKKYSEIKKKQIKFPNIQIELPN